MPNDDCGSLLRSRHLDGSKFRRQHLIGPYVVDFYCPELGLAIELDGGQHYEASGRASDARRTRYLGEHGVRVVRFSNSDVLTNARGVIEVLQTLTPTLSHKWERGKKSAGDAPQ